MLGEALLLANADADTVAAASDPLGQLEGDAERTAEALTLGLPEGERERSGEPLPLPLHV